MLKTLLGLAVALAVSTGTAQAATVMISNSDAGNYRVNGVHNTNSMTAGWIGGSGSFRSYFVFDLASLAGTVDTIDSVSLTFAANSGVNVGLDTSKILGVYGYGGDIPTLLAGGTSANATGVTTFNNLAATSYANTRNVTKPSGTANPAMPAIPFTLNLDGRNGILATTSGSDNRFVIGAALTETYTTNNYIWSGAWPIDQVASLSINYTPTTPIPEPAALALFASGLAGLGFVARRRKAAKQEN